MPSPMNVASRMPPGLEHAVELEQPRAPGLHEMGEHGHRPDQVEVAVLHGSGGTARCGRRGAAATARAPARRCCRASMSQPQTSADSRLGQEVPQRPPGAAAEVEQRACPRTTSRRAARPGCPRVPAGRDRRSRRQWVVGAPRASPRGWPGRAAGRARPRPSRISRGRGGARRRCTPGTPSRSRCTRTASGRTR